MKQDKLIILCINQKKSLERYIIIIKSIEISKMDTLFMNSENNKTSKTYILIIEVTDKLDLRRGEESIAL